MAGEIIAKYQWLKYSNGYLLMSAVSNYRQCENMYVNLLACENINIVYSTKISDDENIITILVMTNVASIEMKKLM